MKDKDSANTRELHPARCFICELNQCHASYKESSRPSDGAVQSNYTLGDLMTDLKEVQIEADSTSSKIVR